MTYRLLRWVARLALKIFFRQIEVEGREHVPERRPVLLVANHCNAFVDALLIVSALDRPVTMTAKRSLWANPYLRPFLHRARAITFERDRDAESSGDPRRNRSALDECRRRLEAGELLCIFPEGESHSDPGPRRFKTGAARIALDYLEASEEAGDIYILPVGLRYEEKDRFRSRAWIGIGEPFDPSVWSAECRAAGKPTSPRALTEALAERVVALSLAFERREEAARLAWAADLIAGGGRTPEPLARDADPSLAERRRLIRQIQAAYPALQAEHRAALDAVEARIDAYRRRLADLGILPREVYLSMHPARAAFFLLRELEILLLGLPIALWGLVNNLVPALMTRSIARALARDEDHFASHAIFLGLPIFALSYGLQISAVWWLLSPLMVLVYAPSLPYSGVYALAYRERAGAARRRARTFLRFLFDHGLQAELQAEGRTILADVRALYGRWRRAHTPTFVD